MAVIKTGFPRKIFHVLASILVLLLVLTAAECPGAATGGIGGGEGDPEPAQRLYIGGIGQVLVVDPVAKIVLETITVAGAGQLDWLAMRPDLQKLYCSDYNNNQVHIIDTATNTHTNSITVNTHPRGIAFNLDSSKAVVARYDAGNGGMIDILDTGTETIDGGRDFGWAQSMAGVDIHFVHNKFYAADMNGCVWVGDISPGNGGTSYGTDEGLDSNYNYDVELSPDGNKLYFSGKAGSSTNYDLYVADIDGGGALSFDPYYERPTSTGSYNRLRISWDSSILFFTDYSNSRIDAIDTTDPGTMTPIAIAGGDGTDAAFSLDSSTAYVLSETDLKVYIVDTSNNTIVDSIDLTGASSPKSMAYAILP